VTDEKQTPHATADGAQERDDQERPDSGPTSRIKVKLASPVNAAIAAHVLSDGSVAYGNIDDDTEVAEEVVIDLRD
jgi:hypothetical protein